MMPEVLRRWLVFTGALVLSLMPALLGLTVLPQLAELPRFFNAAWKWQILATAPAGFARIPFDGTVWLGDSGLIVSLGAWGLAGLAWSFTLLSLRFRSFVLLALPLVLVTGLLAHLLLYALGFAAYVGV